MSEVLARAMAAASVSTRLGEGKWEMEVLVSPHISRQRGGRRVRNWGAAAGLRGGEPLQTVTTAKTDFGLTEGKGECRAAFTPAANLAVGSLFSFFLRCLMKMPVRNLHLYPLCSIISNSSACREETILIHNCLLGT